MSTEATKPNGSSKSRKIPVINVDDDKEIGEIEKRAAAYNVEICLFFIHDEGKNVGESNRENTELVVKTPIRVENNIKRIKETFEKGIVINLGRKYKKREVPQSKDKEQEV